MSTEFSLRHSWRLSLQNKLFRVQLLGTIITLMLLAIGIPYFFNYIQHRDGYVLNDPLLYLLDPRDFSWITFTLIYVSLFLALVNLFRSPGQLVVALQAYCILNFLRIISLWLIPLNEPSGIIVLRDPFVAVIGYGGDTITKDLFFSGHVSMMTLLVISVTNKVLKRVLFVNTIVIASLLLIQHVHYTIDILAAPAFSYASLSLSKFWNIKRVKQ